MNSKFKLHFLGAAECVTGSRFLLETPAGRVLIDCGQFQGLKSLRLRNRESFGSDVTQIDAVFLTHGHLDHCGWLPVLVREGFKGKIYGSEPTLAVATLILRDSAKIQEEEADAANQGGWSRHQPALPLFDSAEAEHCLQHFQSIETHQWHELLPGLKVRWRPIAHILGACFIEIDCAGKRLVFSGDVGRSDDLLLAAPEKPEKADLLLLESTYGNRLHPERSPLEQLQEVVFNTLERGGSLLIPGFAVERMQTLLWLFQQLRLKKHFPRVPIVFDSPMAKNMLSLFQRFPQWHCLDSDTLGSLTSHVHIVEKALDSQVWAAYKRPRIVLAGSGMLNGGRILNYLWNELGNPDTTILLTGYQADGTRGRLLQEGAKEIKMNGHFLYVKAQIETLEGMSSHADCRGLIDWLSELKSAPEHMFLVHGEPDASQGLQDKIQQHRGWNAQIAHYQESVSLFEPRDQD